jgi:hypothetical protein
MPAQSYVLGDRSVLGFRVLVGVVLACLLGVLGGVQGVTVGHVRVMGGLLMITAYVVTGRFAVMLGGVFVVFGGLRVMLGAFVL